MAGQPGCFDVDERLKELSAKGDSLERLSAVVDFDLFSYGSGARCCALGSGARRPAAV
jgi:hypothetical protein